MNRRELLAGAAAAGLCAAAAPAAPVVPKRPVRIEQLGRVRVEDYDWLKPADWKAVWRDPSLLPGDVAEVLRRENAYCDEVLAPTLALQRALAAEIDARSADAAVEPPRRIGAWDYVARFAPGAQHARWLRRPAGGGPETLLLDGERRAAGRPFFRILNAGASRDGTLFAWAEDVTGAEKYRLQIKTLATGEIVAGPMDAFGDFAITPGWLFWTWRSPESRPARVYRRPIAGGPDTLVYEERDPAYFLGVSLCGSGRYVLIRSWNDITGEVRLVDARAPEAPPRLVEPRRAGLMYTLEHWNDRFVVLTNADAAADFKLMLAPEVDPGRANWREWAPCRPGRTIVEMRAFADHFVRVDRVEGNAVLVAADRGGGWRAPAAFDEAAYVVRLQPSDYGGQRLVFTFESPKTPKRWIVLDLASGAKTALSEPPRRRSHPYRLYRMHARAPDGAEVPITVLRRADTPLDGRAPLMLTGYGAYGACYEAVYAAENLSLVDRGWVWAAAHVRGGSEKGTAWFEAARGLKKRASFTDFIACAEALIATRHTARGRICSFGYSAGGLLIGATLNMRPDLFGAAIGRAPFVDILGTMSDASHPLVPLTRPVWGDPLASPADYDNIASYSPCDNVGMRAFPPALATTAVADDRVGFWEPAKWIAALRARSTSGAPMLLHTEMSGGHQGAGGRSDEAALLARMYAFAVWTSTAGLPWPGRSRDRSSRDSRAAQGRPKG